VVTVTLFAGEVLYHVVVSGLVPGSVHAVHDHLGSCTAINRSTHLAVLTIGSANSAGALVFDRVVPAFDFGHNRIMIIYNSAQASVVTGCASL
jgi:hypothetical protein